MDGNFLIRVVYTDEMTFRLVFAAEKILGIYTYDRCTAVAFLLRMNILQ